MLELSSLSQDGEGDHEVVEGSLPAHCRNLRPVHTAATVRSAQ